MTNYYPVKLNIAIQEFSFRTEFSLKYVSWRFSELQIRPADSFFYILILYSIIEHRIWRSKIMQKKVEVVERKKWLLSYTQR